MTKGGQARQAWVRANPVKGALILGLAWGVLCGALTAALAGFGLGVWLFSTVVWCVLGVVGFGPLLVYTIRRRAAEMPDRSRKPAV